MSPRSTVARIRIVAIRTVANPGQRIGFMITASVAKPTPGLSPVLCVALPAGLRLRSAPGATSPGSRPCWNLHELVSGRAQSFRVHALVVARAGATLALHAKLTGANFATRAAATAVDVPPSPLACMSRAHPPPQAKIAC